MTLDELKKANDLQYEHRRIKEAQEALIVTISGFKATKKEKETFKKLLNDGFSPELDRIVKEIHFI